MKRVLTLGCLLLATLSAKAENLIIYGADPISWDFTLNPSFRVLTASSLPDGVTSFPSSLLAAFGGLIPEMMVAQLSFAAPMGGQTQLLSIEFLRAGSVIDASTQFINGGFSYFYNIDGSWASGAQDGDNNYIGFGVKDAADNTYYGYLQFALYDFTGGQIAIEIFGGAINSVANEGIVATAVPEPSTWALGAGAVALGVVAFARRRKVA